MDGFSPNFDDGGGLFNDFELSSPIHLPTHPPDPFAPGFIDFPLSIDDPFCDFGRVYDWILHPSSVPARTDGIEPVPMHAGGVEVEKPDGSVPKEEESGFSAERRGETSSWRSFPDGRDLKVFRDGISEATQEIGIGGHCPDGHQMKIAGSETNEGTHERNGLENPFRFDEAEMRMPELDFEIDDEMLCAISSCLHEQIEDFFSVEASNGISMDAAVGEEGGGRQAMVSVPNTAGKLESNGNEKSYVESRVIASGKGEGSSKSNGIRDSATSRGKEKEDRYDNEKMEDDEELEEGEIRESDGAEIVFRDYEEEKATEGPSTSKDKGKILPPVNVVLESHHPKTMHVGMIGSIMGTKVIIEGVERHNMLPKGSMLWVTETRSPLGPIHDLFGTVKKPCYVVKYDSEEEIPAGIYEGFSVYIVEERAICTPNGENSYKIRCSSFSEDDKQVPDEVVFSDVKETEQKNMLRMAKRGNNNWEQGYRQSVGQNNTQVIEGFQKNAQPSAPPPAGVGPARPIGVNLKFVPGQVQKSPLPINFGSCSSSSHALGQIGTGGLPNSHMTQTVAYSGGPPQHFWLQTNAVSSNGIPSQQEHIPNGYVMNAKPPQQQLNPHHPHQRYPAFSRENPYQPQFNPTQMQLHIVGVHHGIPAGSTTGAMGLGCGTSFLNQGHQEHPFGPTGVQGGSSNGQRLESIVQGGISVPQQYSHGMASDHLRTWLHYFGGLNGQGDSSTGRLLPSTAQGGFNVSQQSNNGMASGQGRGQPLCFGGMGEQGNSSIGQLLPSTAQGGFCVSQQSNNGMASSQERTQPHCFGGMEELGNSRIGQLPPSTVQGGSSASSKSNQGKRWPPRGRGRSKRGRQQSG